MVGIPWLGLLHVQILIGNEMINGNDRYYPVIDHPTTAELKVLGFQKNFNIIIAMGRPFRPDMVGLVAVKTNQYRKPLRDEWFLSGAIPEVFRASCDYAHEYHIMRLIAIETKLQFMAISFHRTKQLTGQ